MTDRPKLWFCFPYRGVGGVSLLFLRVGEELARRGIADVTLIDYADGFMARHRDPALTTLAAYDAEDGVDIPADAVLIFQSMTPWSIYPGLRPDPATRLLFWNCHPYNLVPTLPGARAFSQRPGPGRVLRATLLAPYRARLRRLAALLLERQSLIFMDEPNRRVTAEALGLFIDHPTMVPIPAPDQPPRAPRPLGEPLAVLWIGRIVDFKRPILERALAELDRIARTSGRDILVSIIGGGEEEALLRRFAGRLRSVRIAWLGERRPDELDGMLNDTDLLLAMGTSAIEGARLGVPTLLLDFSYAPVPSDYVFSWLHRRSGFTLGDEAALHRGAAGSMDARLAELTADPQGLSMAARAHFARFHALPVVAPTVNAAALAASCRWQDLRDGKLLGRGRLYSMLVRVRNGFTRS